jgi:hypothetical protein
MNDFSDVNTGTTIATMGDCVGVIMVKTDETDNFLGEKKKKR